MSEKLSESVTIKLSPSQMRMVEGLALHEGTTTSEVIRESIADRFRLAEERYVSLKRMSEALIKRMEAQLRFQHEVLAEIHALTEPDSQHPLTDRDLIRVKAQVALRAASKSGLLT